MIKPTGYFADELIQYVADVNGRIKCFAVDVSTGVKTYSVKDERKIKQFIENVRG